MNYDIIFNYSNPCLKNNFIYMYGNSYQKIEYKLYKFYLPNL